MSHKGLLRNTAADEMTLIDLQAHLKKNHGKILLYHTFSAHMDKLDGNRVIHWQKVGLRFVDGTWNWFTYKHFTGLQGGKRL